MQHSREQEMRQFELMCSMIRSQQVPFTCNPHFTSQDVYAPQQSQRPFPQPNSQGVLETSQMTFSQPNSHGAYSSQQLHMPFSQHNSQGIYVPQQSHMPFPSPCTSSAAHPPVTIHPPIYQGFTPVAFQHAPTEDIHIDKSVN